MNRPVPHPLRDLTQSQAIALGAIGMATGYGILIEWGVPYIFFLGCVFTAIGCAWHGLSSIFSGRLNLSATIASQSILWYIIPFTYIGFFDYDQYSIDASLAENAATAVIVAGIGAVIFLFASHVGATIALPISTVDPKSFLRINLAVSAAQLVFIALGQRGYANVVGAYQDDHETSILYQSVIGFSYAIMPMCAVSIGWIMSHRPYPKARQYLLLNIAIIMIELLWWTTAGRRHMTIILLISILGFFSVYFKGRLTERRVLALAIIFAIMAPLIWSLWESYYTLRIATDVTGGSENLSILDLSRARSLSTGADVEHEFLRNAIERPFLTLSSFSIIRETAEGMTWGWNFLSQALLTIPSAMFPNKIDSIGPVLENLWAARLGTPLNDWSNTIFLESFVDFGFFGFPIYVTILSAAGTCIFRASRSFGKDSLNAFSFFSLEFAFFNTETSINDLLVILRSILIFLALFGILLFLRPARSRRDDA